MNQCLRVILTVFERCPSSLCTQCFHMFFKFESSDSTRHCKNVAARGRGSDRKWRDRIDAVSEISVFGICSLFLWALSMRQHRKRLLSLRSVGRNFSRCWLFPLRRTVHFWIPQKLAERAYFIWKWVGIPMPSGRFALLCVFWHCSLLPASSLKWSVSRQQQKTNEKNNRKKKNTDRYNFSH